MDNNESKRLLELDALRGIAALSVVLFHYFYHYDKIYTHDNLFVKWSYVGQFGVELFFIVSGFVIFWTLNRINGPMDFIVSRFSRLYPVYWCAVIVTFSAVNICGLPGREVSIWDAILNLLMFQECFNAIHVDGVYWTLTIELIFYFWMFIIYLFGVLDKAEFFFVPFIILSIIHSLGIFELHRVAQKILLIKYLPFFISGICFYKIKYNHKYKSAFFIILLSLLSTIVIYSWQYFLIYSSLFTLFFLSISGKVKILSMRPFIFLGSISYSLYLIHQNIGFIIIRELYKYNWNPLISISISILFSIIGANLFTHIIEKPALIYIRNIYKNSLRMQKIACLLASLTRQKAVFFGEK